MTFFSRLSIQHRIFILIGLFAVISMSVIWTVIRPRYEQQVVEERTTVVQQLQHFAVRSIDERLGQWITITQYLAWNMQYRPQDAGILMRQQIAFDTSIIQIVVSSPELTEDYTATSTAHPSFSYIPQGDAWTELPNDSSAAFLWSNDSLTQFRIFGVRKSFLIDSKQYYLTLFADSRPLLHQLNVLPIGGTFAVQIGNERGFVYSTADIAFPAEQENVKNLSVIRDVSVMGTEWKVLSARFSSVPMLMLVAIPSEIILKPVQELLFYSSTIILMVAAMVVVFGWSFSRQLTRPITQLVQDVERLKSLDFSQPVSEPKLREIAAVAATVESMRTVLERYQRINVERIIVEEWRNKFFLSHSEDGICITDENDTFSFMNDRFLQLKESLQVTAPLGNKQELLSHPQLERTKETFREETSGPFSIMFHQKEISIALPEREPQYFRLHDVSITRGSEKLGSLLVLHDRTTERLIDKTKTEMMNFIVHELRNPLNSIMGFSSFIKDEPEMSVTERMEYITIIQQSSRTMNQLVNRFLEVQRLESHSVEYHKEPTDLVAVAKMVCDSQKPQLQAKSIGLTFNAEEGIPATTVAPDLMREAILNLVSNAIKYGDENRTIDVAMKRSGDAILFVITDHGYGISAEHQEKLFSKFFRVTSNAKAATQIGTGLGLAHVKEVMKYHKGEILLESNSEIGCRFTLTIPIV